MERKFLMHSFKMLSSNPDSNLQSMIITMDSVRRNYKYLSGYDNRYLAERFFNCFQQSKLEQQILFTKYYEIITSIYKSNHLKNLFAFSFYDFNNDKLIDITDLHMFETSIPINTQLAYELNQVTQEYVRMQSTKPPNFPSKPIDFQHFLKAVPNSVIIADFEAILFKGASHSKLFDRKFDCMEGEAQINSLVHMPKYRLRPSLLNKLKKHIQLQTERSKAQSRVIDIL